VFDYTTGQQINTDKKHENRVSYICYDKTSGRVLSASYDKTIKN